MNVECRMAPTHTKPDNWGCESACTGCQNLHPPLPFIIITQLKSWYSFYRPTEGRRLSRPSWLVTYRDGLPIHRRSPILVLTGSDVAQLCWSRPTVHSTYSGRCSSISAVVDGTSFSDLLATWPPTDVKFIISFVEDSGFGITPVSSLLVCIYSSDTSDGSFSGASFGGILPNSFQPGTSDAPSALLWSVWPLREKSKLLHTHRNTEKDSQLRDGSLSTFNDLSSRRQCWCSERTVFRHLLN